MAEEDNEQNEEQVSSEDSAAADAPQETASPSAAPVAGAEEAVPAQQLSAKEKRRRKRSTHKGEARPSLSPEERSERRIAERKRKAEARRRYRASERVSKRREAERAARGEGTPPAEREPGTQKTQQGIVVSSKPDKTITVRVESAYRHPAYEKIIRRGKMLHAHDERNEAGPGDTVRLIETRPMSKTKRWRLTEIVEKAR